MLLIFVRLFFAFNIPKIAIKCNPTNFSENVPEISDTSSSTNHQPSENPLMSPSISSSFFNPDESEDFFIGRIMPPGPYVLVIWDKVLTTEGARHVYGKFDCLNDIFVQNSDDLFKLNAFLSPNNWLLSKYQLNILAKCFRNFGTVQTDQFGFFKMPNSLIEKMEKSRPWHEKFANLCCLELDGPNFHINIMPLNDQGVPFSASPDTSESLISFTTMAAVQTKMDHQTRKIAKLAIGGKHSDQPSIVQNFEYHQDNDRRVETVRKMLKEWFDPEEQWRRWSGENAFFLKAYLVELIEFIERKLKSKQKESTKSEELAEIIAEYGKTMVISARKNQDKFVEKIRQISADYVDKLKYFCEIYYKINSEKGQNWGTICQIVQKWPKKNFNKKMPKIAKEEKRRMWEKMNQKVDERNRKYRQNQMNSSEEKKMLRLNINHRFRKRKK